MSYIFNPKEQGDPTIGNADFKLLPVAHNLLNTCTDSVLSIKNEWSLQLELIISNISFF